MIASLKSCVIFLPLISYGVASLTVGGVTALELTVTPDDLHHALIEGIPHKDEDPLRAEQMASRLAAIAIIVDRTRRTAFSAERNADPSELH